MRLAWLVLWGLPPLRAFNICRRWQRRPRGLGAVEDNCSTLMFNRSKIVGVDDAIGLVGFVGASAASRVKHLPTLAASATWVGSS